MSHGPGSSPVQSWDEAVGRAGKGVWWKLPLGMVRVVRASWCTHSLLKKANLINSSYNILTYLEELTFVLKPDFTYTWWIGGVWQSPNSNIDHITVIQWLAWETRMQMIFLLPRELECFIPLHEERNCSTTSAKGRRKSSGSQNQNNIWLLAFPPIPCMTPRTEKMRSSTNKSFQNAQNLNTNFTGYL